VRIVVNRGTCAGIGICEAIDPERFEVQADGKTHVLKGDLEDDEAPNPSRSSTNEAARISVVPPSDLVERLPPTRER